MGCAYHDCPLQLTLLSDLNQPCVSVFLHPTILVRKSSYLRLVLEEQELIALVRLAQYVVAQLGNDLKLSLDCPHFHRSQIEPCPHRNASWPPLPPIMPISSSPLLFLDGTSQYLARKLVGLPPSEPYSLFKESWLDPQNRYRLDKPSTDHTVYQVLNLPASSYYLCASPQVLRHQDSYLDESAVSVPHTGAL